MRRPSIRTLMTFVVVTAVGLASLRNADNLWVGIWLLTALAAVGAALLGAAILRGRERAWWAGFALFCGGYLAISVGPGLSDTFEPRLGTTQLLRYAHARISPLPDLVPGEILSLETDLRQRVEQLESVKRVARNTTQPSIMILTKTVQTLEQQLALAKASPLNRDFRQVGHALFALLAGFIGAVVAGRFYERRQTTETASTSTTD
jgi:hypothetical protein